MNDHGALLKLARGGAEAMSAVDTIPDDSAYADLLHAALDLYAAAARATRTPLGLVALGAWLTDIADTNPDPAKRLAAQLILGHDAAASPETDGELFDVGSQNFCDAIDLAESSCGCTALLLAVVAVWRDAMPDLTTSAGIAALQTLELES